MSLENKVMTALKEAMKAKDQVSLRSLRAMKSAIQLVRTEKGSDGKVSEDKELQIVQKLVKQRKESIDIFQKQNRNDLAKTELEELAIIEKFLPEQLSEDEVKSIVKNIISQIGASSMRDMGKVMGMASKQLAGKADGKMLANLVKQLLSS